MVAKKMYNIKKCTFVFNIISASVEVFIPARN
jgi:hypothetical protein